VTDYAAADFFRDESLLRDPYPYFDFLRGQCPVYRESQHGVVMVTGYEEAAAVQADAGRFSSCNSTFGPFVPFPVPLDGDDVSAAIDQHRYELPFSDMIPSLDPPEHTARRGLLMRLITPRRLKENEAYLRDLAERTVDGFIGAGTCDFVAQFATPYAMLAIADLVGVPEQDRAKFAERFGRPGKKELLGSTSGEVIADNPLAWLYGEFHRYVEERRAEPRDDVLSGLANATFPDGSLPDAQEVVRVATMLFAAGHETSARFLTSAVLILAEHPDLQARLRAEPGLIGNFAEEVLRIESVVKGDFRLARVSTEVGGVTIPAGSHVMLLHGAANRDPRIFDSPDEFRLDRANARHHMAFGRGIHTCPGAPLARAEGRTAIECLLARTSDIRISEAAHGPAGARRFEYVPSFVLRGPASLTLELDPA